MSRLVCCLSLLALAACDNATNATNPGPPLATVHGTMTLGSDQVMGPVRLAVAWYPSDLFSPSSLPTVLITQNVEYTGSFPQSFSFDLFEPPPAGAQLENTDHVHLALGLLIAYQDGNGNGQLDGPQNGGFTDQVLGTSTATASPFDPRVADEWFITWNEADLPGSPKGFNAVRVPVSGDQVAQPLESAQVPLVLTGDPRLNLWICPEEFDFNPQTATNVACGQTRSLTPPQLGVFASIDATGKLILSASLIQNLVDLPNVTGTLNGKPLEAFTFSTGTSLAVEGPETDWLVAGDNVLTLTDGVDPAQTATFQVPQPFQVSAPLTGPVTVPLDVRWTPSVNAAGYQVAFTRGTATPYPWDFQDTTDTQLTVVGPLPTGTGHLMMTVQAAMADPAKNPTVQLVRVQTVDLGP